GSASVAYTGPEILYDGAAFSRHSRSEIQRRNRSAQESLHGIKRMFPRNGYGRYASVQSRYSRHFCLGRKRLQLGFQYWFPCSDSDRSKRSTALRTLFFQQVQYEGGGRFGGC